MADLIRKVNREVLCYFMKADVDEGEDRVASIKRILYSPELDARDRNILLVGGVLDTGITLDYITKHILQGGPRRLKICYLIDKPESRRISISADYAAFAMQGCRVRISGRVRIGLSEQVSQFALSGNIEQ